MLFWEVGLPSFHTKGSNTLRGPLETASSTKHEGGHINFGNIARMEWLTNHGVKMTDNLTGVGKTLKFLEEG
jgi:hypothetical protein